MIEKACPLFVPLVEEGFKEHVVTREIIEYYLESMRNTDIDAMILGCTHYPLIRSKIRDYMGDRIQIVNPAYRRLWILRRCWRNGEWRMTAPRSSTADILSTSATLREVQKVCQHGDAL